MAVFRVEKNRDYTIMSNHHLRNMNLSMKAKGLLSLMLSLPENWDYTLGGLASISAVQLRKIAVRHSAGRFESMPDYAMMYKTLFNSTTYAIKILQEAQQKTEEMYIFAPEPKLRILEPKSPEGGPDKDGRK